MEAPVVRYCFHTCRIRSAKGVSDMHARIVVVLALTGLCVVVLGSAAWAVYGVRISDLGYTPLPPNPIKVWGRVTSESPLKISDGKAEIVVSGLTASVGDYVVVSGDWEGSVLTVTGPANGYVGLGHIPLIYIPAGRFLMGNSGVGDDAVYGNSNEFPQHSVNLSGYWIGKYEVTRGEYRQFMNAGGYSNSSYWSSDGWSWRVGTGRTEPDYWAASQDWYDGCGHCSYAFTQTDNHPVVGVSYYEAEAFCNWAGGHLPTEAQWEKAARWTGSHPNVYPCGDTWDAEKCNNWYDHNAAGGGYEMNQTAPVGSYPSGASPYGCQDMAGNAFERCKDWYGYSYYSQTPPGGWSDPQGPVSGEHRVMRSGGWSYYGDLYYLRCAYRNLDGYGPSYDWYDYGFRLAR